MRQASGPTPGPESNGDAPQNIQKTIQDDPQDNQHYKRTLGQPR